MVDSSAEEYQTVDEKLPDTKYLVVGNLQQIDVGKRTDFDKLTSVNTHS